MDQAWILCTPVRMGIHYNRIYRTVGNWDSKFRNVLSFSTLLHIDQIVFGHDRSVPLQTEPPRTINDQAHIPGLVQSWLAATCSFLPLQLTTCRSLGLNCALQLS
jgi:hypothetical protein